MSAEITTIKIKVNGAEQEMTVAEARELHAALDYLFGQKRQEQVRYEPWWPNYPNGKMWWERDVVPTLPQIWCMETHEGKTLSMVRT